MLDKKTAPQTIRGRFIHISVEDVLISESFDSCGDQHRTVGNSSADLLQVKLSNTGIRFSGRIADYFTVNLELLEGSRWQLQQELRNYMAGRQGDEEWEREIAAR